MVLAHLDVALPEAFDAAVVQPEGRVEARAGARNEKYEERSFGRYARSATMYSGRVFGEWSQ